MKRTIITVVLVACVAVFMTQCKKSDVQKPATDETIDVTLVVDNDAKTVIDGANGNITWEVGDKIHVVGATTGYLGYLTAQSNGNPVTFSGVINYSSVKQVFHYYYVGSNTFTLDSDGCYTFSVATGQDGTLATIADKFQLMYGNSGYALPAGISDLGSTVMRTKTAIANFKFSRTDDAPLLNKVKLTGAYTSMKFNAKTADFAEAVKTGNADVLTISYTENSNCYMPLIPGTQTLNFSQYVVFANLPEKTIEENSLYGEKMVAMHVSSDVPTGALPGKFKISATEYVYFSKGNLFYNTSLTPNWGFEANQWDYQSYPGGWARVNGTSGDNTSLGWGLFGYSTDKEGNNYGASTSTTAGDYSGTFKDWGENIGNGTDWFTLSRTQLNFLDNYGDLKTTGYTSFKLMVGETETTIKGMAFLPSDTPSGEVTDIKNDIMTDLNKIKSYGAVFFPQTSRRNGTSRDEQNYGYIRYQQSGYLYYYGGSSSSGTFWSCSNHYGGLVRLVHNAN